MENICKSAKSVGKFQATRTKFLSGQFEIKAVQRCSFPSSTRDGIEKLLRFHLDFILQKAKRRSYGSNPISLKAFQVQVKNYCFHFACKVEKFKNQLKFCNQILERHNFVHLIKLFRTTRGKHLFKLLEYKIFSLKRQNHQNSAEPPLNR